MKNTFEPWQLQNGIQNFPQERPCSEEARARFLVHVSAHFLRMMVKTRLSDVELFCCSLPGAATVATVLSTGGFNWTLIDAEHGMITDKDYFEVRFISRLG